MLSPRQIFEDNIRPAELLLKVYRLLEHDKPTTEGEVVQALRDVVQASDDEGLIVIYNEIFLGLIRERAQIAPTAIRRSALCNLLRQSVVIACTAMETYLPVLLRTQLPKVIESRGREFVPKFMPAGGIFSTAGQAGFLPMADLKWAVALLSSRICTFLLSLSQGRTGDAAQFEVGLVKRLPWPARNSDSRKTLEGLATDIFNTKRTSDDVNETSHMFCLPSVFRVAGKTLDDRLRKWQEQFDAQSRYLKGQQRQIDEIAFELYGVADRDRFIVESSDDPNTGERNGSEVEEEEDSNIASASIHNASLVEGLLSYGVGCAYGRWDARLACSNGQSQERPDPFAPLPVCAPGSLQGQDSLPAKTTPNGYPLRIDWDGILVNDAEHQDDIVGRVREVVELIWADRAEAIENEACDILGVSKLRDYFRKPAKGGFWDDHVKRYSKSRRKAPIYWLLQSSKKNYSLWLYYHRLDKDILFKALLSYVEPKIQREENRLSELRSQKSSIWDSGKEAKKLDRDIEKQEDSLSELRDFEGKLRKVANLHLDPDLNDGVVLNIAPLHELVPWKEAAKYWEELLDGKYEWSSIGKQLREKGLMK